MTKRKISSDPSTTPEQISEYREALLDASLLRLKVGNGIIAKARKIQEFYEKNSE